MTPAAEVRPAEAGLGTSRTDFNWENPHREKGGIARAYPMEGEGAVATTKRELVRRVAVKTRQKQNLAKKIIQTFLDEVVDELARGNRLEFREFGVFDVVHKRERLARNPRTGDTVKVPAKTVVHFKVGRLMKDKVQRLEQARRAKQAAGGDGNQSNNKA